MLKLGAADRKLEHGPALDQTVGTIRQLFLGDLEADRKRVIDLNTILGISGRP